jgi:hypothetical protein
MFPLSLHNYFEITALICSIIFWKNIRKTPLKWFVPYLFFIVIIEFTGRYIRTELKISNAWLYNISVPLEYLFFVFIFFSFFKSNLNRQLAIAFFLLFSSYILTFLLKNGITNFNQNVLIVGSFSLIIFSTLYLIEFYNLPGILNLGEHPVFIIAVGVLLFNAGEFSYDLLTKFFVTNRMDIDAVIFRSITTYLNLLLYLCISISFLWKKDSVT